VVTFAYNPQSQRIERKDQADSVFAIEYDDIGPMTHRRTTNIDDIAFRRIDNNGNEDYSDPGDAIYYHLTDAQFSTKVVIDSTASVVEWAEYTPYGVASHHHKYDMDNDRDFDLSDGGTISTLAGVAGFRSLRAGSTKSVFEAALDIRSSD